MAPCTARKPRSKVCPPSDHCRAHPGIYEALASVPRVSKKIPDPKTENANRFLRGRVLVQLCARLGLPAGWTCESWVPGWTGTARPSSLGSAIESLERDGLVRTAPAGGPAEAVAEERAAYGAGDWAPRGSWVSLP